MLWPIIVFVALCALYLWLIAPQRNHPDVSALTGKLYAHRGLHDGNHQVPENSLAAFQRAVEAGYGIELDVQLTADQKLIVHHDGNTRRVCGVDAIICQTRYEDLPPLPDGSAIPTFDEVLTLVDGRVPMIVEVKPEGSAVANATSALAGLRPYSGPYCVESFHPMAVRYFRTHAPGIVRGQLAMGGAHQPGESSWLEYFLIKYLLINVFGRPHFVAYSCEMDHNLSMWLMKRVFKPVLAAWTIRSQKTLDAANKDYDLPIFELFTPDEGKTNP